MHEKDKLLTKPSTETTWNRYEEKLFEEAFVQLNEDPPNCWQQIANHVGKSVEQVIDYYLNLVRDVEEIDSGHVELPCYKDDNFNNLEYGCNEMSFGGKNSTKQSEAERKKGTPWSEHEHRLFLIGLHRYGKGDWRSISRNVVITRTPTQVASHAQKYFLRHNSMNIKKERKRSSIHDITTIDDK